MRKFACSGVEKADTGHLKIKNEGCGRMNPTTPYFALMEDVEFGENPMKTMIHLTLRASIWGTLNSRRAINPHVRLVEGEERWEDPDPPQGCPSKLGWNRAKSYRPLHGAQAYGHREAWRVRTHVLEYHVIELKRICERLRDAASCRNGSKNQHRRPDECSLYHYDPTIEQQSSEWKHPSSPTPKRAKTVKSAGKVMTIISFYYEGIVYQHAVGPGTTANGSYYANVLRTMQQSNVEILPYPPYSPDLTPCDFWLFPQLKEPLRGKRFASNKACVKAAEAVLKKLSQNGLLHVFKKWTERWDKCITCHGSYFEKDHVNDAD
ncbi:histone-lysine N-methyltransferase SETMAR [Trichonephila clavipes]|nr:histone-lysine N-methyltransferase SETMAR [Trichonephila clavipes]